MAVFEPPLPPVGLSDAMRIALLAEEQTHLHELLSLSPPRGGRGDTRV